MYLNKRRTLNFIPFNLLIFLLRLSTEFPYKHKWLIIVSKGSLLLYGFV